MSYFSLPYTEWGQDILLPITLHGVDSRVLLPFSFQILLLNRRQYREGTERSRTEVRRLVPNLCSGLEFYC